MSRFIYLADKLSLGLINKLARKLSGIDNLLLLIDLAEQVELARRRWNPPERQVITIDMGNVPPDQHLEWIRYLRKMMLNAKYGKLGKPEPYVLDDEGFDLIYDKAGVPMTRLG